MNKHYLIMLCVPCGCSVFTVVLEINYVDAHNNIKCNQQLTHVCNNSTFVSYCFNIASLKGTHLIEKLNLTRLKENGLS